MRWSYDVRKRADKDHTHKKQVKKQKQHLYLVKSESQLRQIVLASRKRQK